MKKLLLSSTFILVGFIGQEAYSVQTNVVCQGSYVDCYLACIRIAGQGWGFTGKRPSLRGCITPCECSYIP
jgi:hypothetical protein